MIFMVQPVQHRRRDHRTAPRSSEKARQDVARFKRIVELTTDLRLIPVLGIDTCQHVAGDTVFYRRAATLERQPGQASGYGDNGKNASEHKGGHGELLE